MDAVGMVSAFKFEELASTVSSKGDEECNMLRRRTENPSNYAVS